MRHMHHLLYSLSRPFLFLMFIPLFYSPVAVAQQRPQAARPSALSKGTKSALQTKEEIARQRPPRLLPKRIGSIGKAPQSVNGIATLPSEGFESGIPGDWLIENEDADVTWEPGLAGAFSASSGSAFVNFFNYFESGQLDILKTPAFSVASGDSLFFDLAYSTFGASATSTFRDSLFVIVSTDGGATFDTLANSVYRNGFIGMRTDSTTSNFVPDANEWRTIKANMTPYVGTNVVLAFVAKNGFGNNLYIDNITVTNVPPPPPPPNATVKSFYALGGFQPQGFVNPLTATVQNNSMTAQSFSVQFRALDQTSTQVFSTTVPVTGLASGATQTVTATDFAPTTAGTYTLIAKTILTGDGNPNDDSLTATQVVGSFATHADPSQPAVTGGVGFGGATGDFVSKFTSNGARVVDTVYSYFASGGAASPGEQYQVGVWADDGTGKPGALIYSSDPLTVNAQDVYEPVVLPGVSVNGTFFVGTRQIGTTNIGAGFQEESPLRPTTFYFASPTGATAWTEFGTLTFKLMFGAHLSPPPPNNVGVTTVKLTTPPPYTSGSVYSVRAIFKNLGSTPISAPFPVSYRIDNGTAITQTYTPAGNFAPNAADSITFTTTFTPATPATYTLKGYTGLTGDSNPGDDTSTAIINVTTLVSSFPYLQDFESGAGGWVAGTLNANPPDWELGTPSKTQITGAQSGANAWATKLSGDYSPNQNAVVVSPVFNFSALTAAPTLSLWNNYDMETSFEGGIIEFSTDGGSVWTKLGGLQATDPDGINWYNNNNSFGPIPAPKWSGSNGGWVKSSHLLTGLAGQAAVQFRVRFGSDGIIETPDGWAFDDIEIVPAAAVDIAGLDLSPTRGALDGVTTFNFKFRVRNAGISPIASYVAQWSVDGTVQPQVSGGAIAPAGRDSLTLAWTTPTPGLHDIKAWAVVAGDGVASNDTVQIAFTGYFAHNGGPDGGGFFFADNLAPGPKPAYTWIDDADGIDVTANFADLDDASVEAPFPAGFIYKFYDKVIDNTAGDKNFVINTNGWVGLDPVEVPTGGFGMRNEVLLPNSGTDVPKYSVFALWDDLEGTPDSSRVTYKYIGNGGVVVTWTKFRFFVQSARMTFQTVLGKYPGGGDTLGARVVYKIDDFNASQINATRLSVGQQGNGNPALRLAPAARRTAYSRKAMNIVDREKAERQLATGRPLTAADEKQFSARYYTLYRGFVQDDELARTALGPEQGTSYHFHGEPVEATPAAGTPLQFATLQSQLGAPLPVEFAAFTASATASGVDLMWQTATEKNNLGFQIQRSADNAAFTDVANGFVKGNGTTTEAQTYRYTDRQAPTGKAYYRLKQLDTDGKFDYSKTVEVVVALPKKFTLAQNYPNPFNPSTAIQYQLPRAVEASLKVYDVLGREVATLVNQRQDAGNYTLRFDAARLSTGVYFYKLKAGDFTETKKMLLVK